jgi:hypothetical protein
MTDKSNDTPVTPDAAVPDAAPASEGRRKFLKAAAVTGAAAASSGLIDGFPLVWSQTMKDVKLVQVGGSYSAIKEIADQATKDLGFKVEMQTAPHDALLNRLLTQPQSIDIADIEYFFQMYLLPKGTLHPMEVKKIKLWDKVVPIFSKGEYPDGRKVSNQGILPFEVQYIEKPGDKKFATKPTDYITGIPTVYNADTLGIRPDLVKRKIESWAELLNPEWKGKTSIVSVPGIGIMDAAMALEARGDIKYKDKAGDRQDHRAPDQGQEGRPVPRLLGHLRRIRQPDGRGRDGCAVHVVAGSDRRALARYPLLLRSAQGRLSRLGQLHRADGAPQGAEARRGLRVHQLVHERLAGRLHRQAGLLQLGTRDGQEVHDRGRVRLLVRGQARQGRDQGPVWRGDGEGRRGARRRRVLGPDGQSGLLEHPDGREPLHGVEVERVPRGVMPP